MHRRKPFIALQRDDEEKLQLPGGNNAGAWVGYDEDDGIS